jgi:hypothetical protein
MAAETQPAPNYRIVRVGDAFELYVRAPFGWLSPYEPQGSHAECVRMYERISEGERPHGN